MGDQHDKALVPARSLASAELGQPMYVDRHGNVTRPWYVREPHVLSAVIAIVVCSAAIAAFAAGSIAGPVAIFGATVSWELWAGRNGHKLRAARALALRGERDAAHAAFLALERKSLPRASRDSVALSLAQLAAERGARDEAVARLDAMLARLEPRGRDLTYWMTLATRGEVGVVSGDLERGRQVLEALAEAPRGDVYELLRQSQALVLAFHTGSANGLPDGETLHAWARAALGRSQFGGMLVTLAWAFEQRGDEGMARHLLAEAPARMRPDELRGGYPRIHAWLEERQAAWASVGD